MLYLLFNEGYAASAGADLVRQGLCAEAIRLARVLAELMPDEPEALGLLALMLLHDARRGRPRGRRRRPGDAGGPGPRAGGTAPRSTRVPASARRCAAPRPAGPYQLQAAIAACHATAAGRRSHRLGRDRRCCTGGWREIMPSPVVELNRAVAVAMAEGPAAGLELVAAIEDSGALAGYHLLPATRADLLRRLGRRGRGRGQLPRGPRPGRHRRRTPLPRPPPSRNHHPLPSPASQPGPTAAATHRAATNPTRADSPISDGLGDPHAMSELLSAAHITHSVSIFRTYRSENDWNT